MNRVLKGASPALGPDGRAGGTPRARVTRSRTLVPGVLATCVATTLGLLVGAGLVNGMLALNDAGVIQAPPHVGPLLRGLKR